MSNFYREKLALERSSGSRASVDDKSTTGSYTDKLIADSPHLVHRLKAKDTTGRWAIYFVRVSACSEANFLTALKEKESIDLTDYGQVVASCYGEKPSSSLIEELKNRFGWDID